MKTNTTFLIRMPVTLKKKIKQAAKKEGFMHVSEWIRFQLVKQVNEVLNK